MYAVVGCSNCEHLWIVAGQPERTQCPRCDRSRKHDARRKFFTSEDEDAARQARSAILAARAGQDEAFDAIPSYGDLEADLRDTGVDVETYLERMGLDPEEVAAAGDDETGTTSGSRKEIVMAAVRTLTEPTQEDIVEYAAERDVPQSYTQSALEKLHRDGMITRDGGAYRLL